MEPVSWWAALKGIFAALPKLIDLFSGMVKQVQQRQLDAWERDLDEATRLGMEAAQKGMTLEQAKEYAKRLRDVTGAMPGR